MDSRGIAPEHYRLMRSLMVVFLVSGVGVGIGFAAEALAWRWLSWVGYSTTGVGILCAGWLIMRYSWRRLNVLLDLVFGERRAK